ncbi:MAG TPA: nuclear transport factor 2 family protein, partial [Candidatus Acidoferrales bacterium]|nr:nuclear transport factor 2 family protein [Candidatus Acidoferrales bacterium]
VPLRDKREPRDTTDRVDHLLDNSLDPNMCRCLSREQTGSLRRFRFDRTTQTNAAVLDSVPKEGPMNRLFSLLLISVFALAMWTRISSKPPSDDEGTLKNLEMEGAKHPGYSDTDIAFQKSNMATRVISIDPLGHVYDQTPADYEKMAVGIRTGNPDAKASMEIHDIKVSISGDTAVVTFGGTYTSTGFKDPNANVPGAHFVSVDTWQKQSGKWKLIAGAAVSTEPIPAEAYKMPAPGASN